MKKTVDALAMFAFVFALIASPTVFAQGAAPATKTQESPKVLDLRPPDITKSPKLKEIALGQSQLPEKIEIVGTPELLPQTDSEMPRPWMGPAAVIWGLIHPLSAWRIVAPVSPEVGLAANGKPNLDNEILRMSMK